MFFSLVNQMQTNSLGFKTHSILTSDLHLKKKLNKQISFLDVLATNDGDQF